MKNVYPKLQAVLAAVLFGASAPFSKLILGETDPVLLAALLYLGCGIGMLLLRAVRVFTGNNKSKEAALTRGDIPWLAGAVLFGGVAAPIVLMISLKITPAATASLLLNFEAVSTSIIASLFFKESLGKYVWAAVALITTAGIILTWDSSGNWGFSAGAAGIILACVFWGVDNNFTRRISIKDPSSIVTFKGLIAGTTSLVIALSADCEIPGIKLIVLSLILGFLSYGISIILFIYAMRTLGAARTSTFFGSAPFIGAIISLVLFGELPGISFIVSLPLMLAGAVLILRENHAHVHLHEAVVHEHRHKHTDGHHMHGHEWLTAGEAESAEHTHLHAHPEIEHSHTHTPDIHHEHKHT